MAQKPTNDTPGPADPGGGAEIPPKPGNGGGPAAPGGGVEIPPKPENGGGRKNPSRR